MYTDKLTIKDRENDSAYNVIINDSKQFHDIENNFLNSDKDYESKISAATDLCEIIRSNLWFEPLKANTPMLSEDFIESEHRTNCFGYTIVCSECLEKLSIDHSIAFANGHSFVIINDQSRHYLCDPTSKDVSGHIEMNLGDNIDDKIAKNNYATTKLNTRSICFNNECGLYFDELTVSHPWMSFHNYESSSPKKDWDDCLIMKLYKGENGRDMLQEYSRLLSCNLNKDYENSALAIFHLGEMYPNVDSRNHFYEIRETVRGLIDSGNYDLAKSLVNEGLSQIDIEPSMEAAFLIPKFNRSLGKAALDRGALLAASASYKAVSDNSKYSQVVRSSAVKAIEKIETDIASLD